MMRAPIFILAAFITANSAAGQDGSEGSTKRTPDNARRFLSGLPAVHDIAAASYGSHHSRISSRVSDIRHEGDCVSILDAVPRSYIFRDSAMNMATDDAHPTGRADLFAPHSGRIAALRMVKPPYRLDWAKVVPIVQSPPSALDGTPSGKEVLRVRTSDLAINVFFPSEELASRAMLAMETLRIACDPVADTGF